MRADRTYDGFMARSSTKARRAAQRRENHIRLLRETNGVTMPLYLLTPAERLAVIKLLPGALAILRSGGGVGLRVR